MIALVTTKLFRWIRVRNEAKSNFLFIGTALWRAPSSSNGASGGTVGPTIGLTTFPPSYSMPRRHHLPATRYLVLQLYLMNMPAFTKCITGTELEPACGYK